MIEFYRIDHISPHVAVYQCEDCASMTTDTQRHIDWHKKIHNQMRYFVPKGIMVNDEVAIEIKESWTLQELIDGGIITSRRILRKEP